MHMTRPKSSKGRTRVRVTQALAADEGVHQSHMFSPHPPPSSTPTVIPTRAVPRQSSRPSAEVHSEIFEPPPDVPVLSLNKYKVLPSIEKRPGDVLTRGVEEKVSRLSLSDSTVDGDKQLLLAIRTPCGQRFKWHFQPTDTLQAVIAAAEAKCGERYKHAVIETMEVPRQTFTNLTMSLSQCGIFNKSVLCISLEDSAVDY
uniref:UBX domain-containing protein n=1 Tax=Pygocentrus nattereri TaxID=42514 RepID=A0AAR2LFQ3_PYGNA